MNRQIKPPVYDTPVQLKMPVEIEQIIEVNDLVYSFNEVLRHIDLRKYFVERKVHKTGRPKYDMENRSRSAEKSAAVIPEQFRDNLPSECPKTQF